MRFEDADDAAEAAERKGSQYLSRKDVRNLAIVLVVLLVLLYPVYRWLLRGAEEHICKKNLKDIAGALGAYKEEFGDHFPPMYAAYAGSDAPLLDDEGVAVTWGTSLAPYLKEASNFTCPTAEPEERALSHGSKGGRLGMTYGMFAPYSTELAPAILDPGRTIVVAESSNFGAHGTYDPLKFTIDGKAVAQDGFVIGFDDAQHYPTDKSKLLTRLAFPNTREGNLGEGAEARHGDSINALTADGSLVTLSPSAAHYRQGSYWNVPVRR